MSATILIVDDLEDNRAVLARRLERFGYTVHEACDGSDAVAQCMNNRFDLIIMDISMPEMDGIEAWRSLQEMCDNPPPAIALTAVRIRDVEMACRESGFSAYLEKPCDTPVLICEVKRCLAIRNAA